MILKKEVWISPYKCNRTLHIYVPEQCSIKNPASVLYMFDGHNLYFDHEATYGKSWGIKEYLDQKNARLMVVGLECNHEGNERLSEFTPYDFYEDEWGTIHQKGRAFYSSRPAFHLLKYSLIKSSHLTHLQQQYQILQSELVCVHYRYIIL